MGALLSTFKRKGGTSSYDHAVESIVQGGSSHHSHHIDTENLSSLKDYERSYASKAKEETIKKMARAMKKVGMNVNPDDDLDKIINDLNREIPNPKKGKTFASESKTQEKVCRIVAGVLNDEFTPGASDSEKFIDMTLPPIEICRAVGEYTHSFNQGVNTEFLGVIGSVKNALHSMNLMDHVMDELYKKIQANIGKVDDSILEREIKPLNDVYIRAKHEREQKKMVLENLLHVHLEPASRVLNDALKEHGNDLALVKKLGLKLGSTDFANAIAAALSGLGSTASIANHVHKALKTVGISMNEYVNSHSFKEFQQKLDSIVDEGKMTDKDLVKFLHASKYLREGFDYRTDEKFKKIIAQGGRHGMAGGQYSGGRRSSYNMNSLDAVDTDVFGNPLKSSIRRKARSIMAEKELISKDFVVRLDRHYNELLEAMKDIAINLGKTIPLTTKTDLLKDALQHLDEASRNTGSASDEMTIEIIVSRGIDTMDARRKKEQYINKLKMIANACESIMGMEAYRATSSKFAKVKEIVSKIEKMIEYYSGIGSKNRDRISDVGEYDRKYADSIRNPLGPPASSVSKPMQSNSDDEGDTSFAEGGASFEYKEIDVPQIAKTGLTLNEIINTFNYYYYLAGVRNNLKISSKEYDLFGEDYSNMLGNSIAKRLYELDLSHKKDIRFINEHLKNGDLLDNATNPTKVEKIRTEAKKWVDSEYNIKIKFYKALQALDLYLKEFTPAITSNIDTVKEIKTMLDETQVIARWFNESTGDKLCEAFDQLPGYNISSTGVTFTDNLSNNENEKYPNIAENNQHYYKSINDNIKNKDTVTFGNPAYGRSILHDGGANARAEDAPGINKVKTMKESVDSAIDHFQALKNIVNTFIRIGNKFGTTDLSTKVFMSPSQIYRVLFTFLKHSALRMHIPNQKAYDDEAGVVYGGRPNSALMLTLNARYDDQLNISMGGINMASRELGGGNPLNTLTRDPRNLLNTVAPFSVYFTGFANGFVPNPVKAENHYEIENVFFHAMLKAMAGKIMTVVSSYDMLEMAPPKHWITDTRMILGGGMKQINGVSKTKQSKGRKFGGGEENPVSSDDRLEIIQEALPLYFKLPRLIEFYKEILNPDTFESKPDAIAFLPDLDGLFTSLFLLIFRKSKTPENGEYSDMELHKIVEEINIIYRYYAKQKSHDITTAVINDVVLDVNRKYGLLKKDDYTTWVEMTKERDFNGSAGQIRVNTTNYSILPDEDEYEVNKFAPSDIYKGVLKNDDLEYDQVTGKYKNRLTGEISEAFSGETLNIATDFTPGGVNPRETMHPHANLIKTFRETLDTYFKDSDIQNMSSYTILVHQAEDDVKNARSNREKISTVFQLIQGTGNLGLKNDKAILFHETIIAGLNVLSGIYMMLERYMENIKHSDPLNLEKKLVDILYGLLCVAEKPAVAAIDFWQLTKNNDTYAIAAAATRLNAADASEIGQCHLRDPNRTNNPNVPTIEQGGSYFFNDGIVKKIFTPMSQESHMINFKEHKYLVQPIMIDEPIFRGTKILPYCHINGNILADEAHMGTYANDMDNLYDLKRVNNNNGAIANTEIQTIARGARDEYTSFYYGDYGNGITDCDLYSSSHPTYRILETIVTKVNICDNALNARLFSTSNVAGAVQSFVLPSTIIDYKSTDNKGVLKNQENIIYMRQRNGTLSEAILVNNKINDEDRKKLLFMRLLSRTGVNYQYIMENLLENMYSLIIDSNGLIDLTYYKTENNKTKLNLNFTKLQNVVNGIITDLKFYLEYFRPFLKKDVIAHYEDSKRSGSIYDLETKFNYFFNPNTDRYNTEYRNLDRANALNTDGLSDMTSEIFNNLTRDTHVAMSVLKQLLPGQLYQIYNINSAVGWAPNNPQQTIHIYNNKIINGANQMRNPDGTTEDVIPGGVVPDTTYSIYDLLFDNYKHNSDNDVKNNANRTGDTKTYVPYQYKHNTRYEWYGGTLSNLIFYDFSKKMPYNRLLNNIELPSTITPTFTVETQLIKIDEFDGNVTKYKDARFATEFYCYPHGHFKLRELLGTSGNEIKALDMQVTVPINAAAAAVQFVPEKSADTINNVLPISNYRTLYRYTAISMFSETTLNTKNQDANPFKFDEYIQLSAQRMDINLRNNFDLIALNTADFGEESHYPTMEELDCYSYPKKSSDITMNSGYNMGISVKSPKLPSKDFEYKLHDLIARSPKTSDSRSISGHLIQWPHARNGDSAVREYIRAPLYSHECVAFDHNSLMFIFNQILSRFLNAFIDPSTGNKIYKNLVNGFINGVSSKVVSQPDTGFPDLYRCGTNNVQSQRFVAGHSNESSIENQHSMMFQKVLGLRGDVKPDSIVFQSLAYILQRIGKDLDRGSGSNLHLLNTLTDVPIYMKESYKANLPSFIKIFDYIIQKAEFFKNVIQKTDIKLNRYSQCDFANFINSCTGLTDVRVNDVRYELHSYFVPAKYLLGLDAYPMPFFNSDINLTIPNMNTVFTVVYGVGVDITPYKLFKNNLLHLINLAPAALHNLYIAHAPIATGNGFAGIINVANAGYPMYNAAYAAHAGANAETRLLAFLNYNNMADPVGSINGNIYKAAHLLILKLEVYFIIALNLAFNAGAMNNVAAAPNTAITIDIAGGGQEDINALARSYFRNAVYATNFYKQLITDLRRFKTVSSNGNATTLLNNISAWAIAPSAINGSSVFMATMGAAGTWAEISTRAITVKNYFGISTESDIDNQSRRVAVVSYSYAADYTDYTIDPINKTIRKLHALYNSANNYHIGAFDAELDRIHSSEGMIKNTNRTQKEELVKISCTRGTRGYNLQFKKISNDNIFKDYQYNYEFLKITDKNANKVNGFLSIDGIDPLTTKNQNSDEVKEKLLSILDSIVANAYSMSDCCDEVLKELGDTPVYFETYDGSIENYQVRNNAEQLMPLSLTLWFMNNNYPLTQSQNIGPSHVLFSGHNLSTANFKLLYGTRQVLARNLPLTYEEIPGVKTILARHNSSASDRPMEESRYLQFVNRLMTGLRFIVNSHGYKRVVAYNSNGVEIITNKYVNPIDNIIWKFNNNSTQFVSNNTKQLLHFNENDRLDDRNTVYALKDGKRTRELLLQLLEDSFQENSVNKILQSFYINEKQSKGISRKQERIKVIIDSSINPINVHALMQDIPLANIYNYQYTFETMAASMYGMLMRNVGNEEANNESKHPLKQTILEFLRLLRDPFASINKQNFQIGSNYEQPLFNIFIGDGSLGMGRPKFLSDQLFNKCLLNNIYYENTRPMVKGPSPRRGKEPFSELDRGLVTSDHFGYDPAPAPIVAPLGNLFETAVAGLSGPGTIADTLHTQHQLYEDSIVAIAAARIGGGGVGPCSYADIRNPANDPVITAGLNTGLLNEFDYEIFRLLITGRANFEDNAAVPDQQMMSVDNLTIYVYNNFNGSRAGGGGNQIRLADYPINRVLNRLYSNNAAFAGNDRIKRYRELLKKTIFYKRFMQAIATPEIYNYFRFNNKSIEQIVPNFLKKLELIVNRTCEIAYISGIIEGDVVEFGVPTGGPANDLCQNGAGGSGNPVVADIVSTQLGYNNVADNLRTVPVGGGVGQNLINYRKMCSFYIWNLLTYNINITGLITDYNSKIVNKFPQGYNPNVYLVMSYLREYQYRGKFEQTDYDTIDNKSNPLVRFEYTVGDIPMHLSNTLQNIGFLRFNTNVIRNLFFISNILRIIRLQINREFTQNRSILKSSHFAISPSVTEYGMMDPNESFNSTYRDAKSFNDSIENYSNEDNKETYYDLIDDDTL